MVNFHITQARQTLLEEIQVSYIVSPLVVHLKVFHKKSSVSPSTCTLNTVIHVDTKTLTINPPQNAHPPHRTPPHRNRPNGLRPRRRRQPHLPTPLLPHLNHHPSHLLLHPPLHPQTLLHRPRRLRQYPPCHRRATHVPLRRGTRA